MQEGGPTKQEGEIKQEQEEDMDSGVETSAPATKYFDLKSQAKKQSEEGVGFNQFDPVLSLSGFIGRRFGIVGGLSLVAILAATEGKEILAALLSNTKEGSGEVITTPSGLQYVDKLIYQGEGDSPQAGRIIALDLKVTIGDVVLYDSKAGKNPKAIAFRYGQRPFQNVLCEGVEEGIQGMLPGSSRTLLVPKNLAPPGVNVPEGAKLKYDIELKDVTIDYLNSAR
jgi:hypothetical protein